MAEVASAYVTLIPSARGFGAATEKQVAPGMQRVGGKIGKAFGAALGGGIVALGFLKSSLGEAREAQKVGAQTNSVIRATGGAAKVSAKQVGDLAGAISAKSGIDDEVIQSGQNMLLTFKNIRNEAGKGNDIFSQSTQVLTDMSVAMGTEPKQAAIQLGKALNDPIKGISALSRVGVTFDAQQKKTIKSLVATGNTMGAQKIILKELNSEFGGSAAAQATAGDKARVAWGNLQETLGTKLLPVVDRLATFSVVKVIPALSSTASWVSKNKAVVGTFVGVLVAMKVASAAAAAVSSVMAQAQAAQAVAAGTATAAQIELNAAMRANLIGIVVVALAALAAGLVYAYKHSETFRNAVNKLWAAFRFGLSLLPAIGAKVLSFFAGMLHAIGSVKGFGWAETAANKLDKMAAKADAVAAAIRGIPSTKYVNISTSVTGPFSNKVAGMDLAHRATGGPVNQGQTYLVGERGPELFTASSNGHITPNNQLAASHGRSVSTQRLHPADLKTLAALIGQSVGGALDGTAANAIRRA